MRNFPNNIQFGVDPYSGGFTLHCIDLIVPAPGIPLLIERFHDSLACFSPSSGWKFNFDESIRYDVMDESMIFESPNGIKERFIKNPNGSYASSTPGSLNTLRNNLDGSFTLTFKDKIKHLFYAPDTQTHYGNLYKIVDTHNNTITFYWTKMSNKTRITRIKDPARRILNFSYETTSEGADLMHVTDWSGRKLTYTYISGWLTYFKDFDGNITTYVPGSKPGESSGIPGEDGYIKMTGIYELICPNGFWLRNYGQNRPDTVRVFKQVYADGSVILYDYDWDNFKTTVADGDKTTLFEYNEDGELQKITDALGNETFYDYDELGRTIKVTDPRGGQTTFTYDEFNNMLTRTDAQGNTTSYEYDAKWHKVTKITSPEPFEFETSFEYDENTGDLLSSTDPLDNITSFEYYANGLIKKITDPKDHILSFAYDNFGNLITITDALSHETRFKYNQLGNPVTITDAKGNKITKDYYASGLLKTLTNALGLQTVFKYDFNLNLKSLKDPLNNSLQYKYGFLNQLLEVSDALGAKLQFQYDQYGNLSGFSNAGENTTSFTFDALDRVLCATDALSRESFYAYDPYCNKYSFTNAEGKKTTYLKDTLCRLTRIEYHDNSAVQFTYDTLGRRTVMIMPQSRKYGEFKYGELKYGYEPDASDIQYEYDTNSRLTKIHYPNDKTIGIAYDEAGNISSIYDIDEVATAYEYDELNRLAKVTYNEAETTYEYDEVSNLTKMTLPNGITADFEYDAAYRLTRILYKKGEAILYDLKYELDAAGNRVRKVVSTPPLQDKVYNYVFDGLYRLKKSFKDGNLMAEYRFDATGNRLEKITTEDTTTYDYNAADEILCGGKQVFTHDQDGNLIKAYDLTTNGAMRYQYNYAGKLWKAIFPDGQKIEYLYDGDGLRIKKVDPTGKVTNYYWLPVGLGHVLNETDGEGNTQASYIIGKTLIGIATKEGVKYFLYDALGSVIALTDENGNITDTYDYDDFGNSMAHTGSSCNPYRYAGIFGYYYDEDTGLYYLRNRYYSPELGRFIAKDPYQGLDYKPGNLNYFVYVSNNPINLVDPLGLTDRYFTYVCYRPIPDSSDVFSDLLGEFIGNPYHSFISMITLKNGNCSMTTLSGFPENFTPLPPPYMGNLIGKRDERGDLKNCWPCVPVTQESNQILQIKLIKAFNKYSSYNASTYALFPEKQDGYNSNSLTRALLYEAGVENSNMPNSLMMTNATRPGWNKPVPL